MIDFWLWGAIVALFIAYVAVIVFDLLLLRAAGAFDKRAQAHIERWQEGGGR